LGAFVALTAAIVLILRKVSPAYGMIAGAFIGGIVGGANITDTVNVMIEGAKGMVPAVLRILAAGVLAGVLMESGAAASIAKTIVGKLGETQVLLALATATMLLAPVSGIFMSGATASTTAGAAVASSVFGPTITSLGISALAGAAMIHAGATVLDHLPHGSFFHATAGSVHMEIKERLKLIPYESLIGLTLTVISTLIFGVFRLFS
jgi:gluconate:H+ symporter, GntP family